MKKQTTRAHRGFACLTPEQRLETARKGGAAVPAAKRSFAKNRELAVIAGRKGGKANRRRHTSNAAIV